MSDRMNHYVCDKCGNYWRAMRSSKCPACRRTSLWEFPPDKALAARLHMMRIRREANVA